MLQCTKRLILRYHSLTPSYRHTTILSLLSSCRSANPLFPGAAKQQHKIITHAHRIQPFAHATIATYLSFSLHTTPSQILVPLQDKFNHQNPLFTKSTIKATGTTTISTTSTQAHAKVQISLHNSRVQPTMRHQNQQRSSP